MKNFPDKYINNIKSRPDNKKTSGIIVIMTRLHDSDPLFDVNYSMNQWLNKIRNNYEINC